MVVDGQVLCRLQPARPRARRTGGPRNSSSSPPPATAITARLREKLGWSGQLRTQRRRDDSWRLERMRVVRCTDGNRCESPSKSSFSHFGRVGADARSLIQVPLSRRQRGDRFCALDSASRPVRPADVLYAAARAQAPAGERPARRSTPSAISSSRASRSAGRSCIAAAVRTTVAATTQTAETTSTSEMVWRVVGGAARRLGHVRALWSIGSICGSNLTGSNEVHYDSRTDLVAAAGLRVSGPVGRRAAVDRHPGRARAKSLQRKRFPVKAAVGGEGEITLRLPEEPVAVGQQWSVPHDIELPLPNGGIRKIKARQTFALLGGEDGRGHRSTWRRRFFRPSTIRRSSPIDSIRVGRARCGSTSTRAGFSRQEMEVDKGVVGFRGEASSIHYLTRFTEEFAASQPAVAARGAEEKR